MQHNDNVLLQVNLIVNPKVVIILFCFLFQAGKTERTATQQGSLCENPFVKLVKFSNKKL